MPDEGPPLHEAFQAEHGCLFTEIATLRRERASLFTEIHELRQQRNELMAELFASQRENRKLRRQMGRTTMTDEAAPEQLRPIPHERVMAAMKAWRSQPRLASDFRDVREDERE
jgi:regulator of replication initiation timing